MPGGVKDGHEASKKAVDGSKGTADGSKKRDWPKVAAERRKNLAHGASRREQNTARYLFPPRYSGGGLGWGLAQGVLAVQTACPNLAKYCNDRKTKQASEQPLSFPAAHQRDDFWTHHSVARLARPPWSALIAALYESEAQRTVIDPSGRRHVVCGEDAPVMKWFSYAMVSATKQARKKGVFERLPKRRRCMLSVQNHDCGFFWSTRA